MPTQNLPTRNNNPGDLRNPATGNFQQFASPKEGFQALVNDLHDKQSGNTSTGLGPDSSLADFAKVYAPPGDSNNSGQYAANLANKLGVPPNTPIKNLDLGKWAEAVASNEGYQGAGVGASLQGNTGNTAPVAQGVNIAQASTGGDTPPESTLQKVGDVAGSIGNFLFPVASDIYDAATGHGNGKTALQVAGDTAMSALPFIPGLGEAGEAAKGAEAATEGASLLGKVAGSTVTKGALAGYGYGSAQNLSQGQSLGQAFTPNLNNVGGGLLGGATPIALKGVSAAAKGLSGVSDQIINALKDSGISTDDYNSYINAAKARATNVRAPAPLELAANQLDSAAKTIQTKTDTAGEVVGAAKKAAASTPLAPLDEVGQKLQQHVGDKYGLDLRTDPKTGNVKALPQAGNMRQVAPGDVARIENIASQINNLHANGGTVKNATEVIDNLNNLVDHSKTDIYGKTNDPLEGLIKDTAGNLNKVVRKSSSTLADANDKFSALKNLQDEITKMAGGNLNRGELLMKRVFSGDKSGDVQNLFGKIKDETGIDLVNHAVLAKHAIDVAGDESQKSLLQQAIEGGTAITKGPLAALLHAGKVVGQKVVGNPETIGRNAVKGTEGLTSQFIKKGATKSAIVGSRGIPSLLGL